MRRSWIVVVVLVLLGLFAGPPIPAGARVVHAASGRTPSKIDYVVLSTIQKAKQIQTQARRAEREGSSRVPSVAKASNTFVHVRPNATIEILVHSVRPATNAQLRQLRRLGATQITTAHNVPRFHVPNIGMTDVWVPIDRVQAVASLPWVAAITPPGYPASDAGFGTIVSQGVTLHRANTVQDVRGINGAGVTVGVSSNGVSSISASQTAGELPSGVTVDDAGSGDEGTAMLEIVADMAPSAGLVFDASNGLTDYTNSLQNLATKTNVIAEDLAFDNEPAFQEGIGAQTGDNIAANGVSVESSAGNRAQNHVARVVANGTGTGPDGTSFTSTPTGCANTPDNVVDIDPGSGTAFDMVLGNDGNGNGTSFTLQWSEPRAIFPTIGRGGFTDLNLYIMNTALTQCLAQSVGVQSNGQGDTIEQLVTPSGLSGTAVKVVVDVQGTSSAVTAPLIDLRWRNDTSQTDATTAAGSLNPDSNYTGAADAVAAVNGNGTGLEGFSSQGPVQLVTTTQCPGGGTGPCTGAAGPASQTFQQPVWAAADGVSVSGVGGFGSPFFGTSAAAPSAAGCEALLRSSPQSSPTASPTSTNARLAATAVGPANPNVTGAGTLDCLAAVNRPPVANAGGPYTTNEGQNVTLDGTASSDPDTGDSIASFAWDLDNNGSFETAGATPTFDAVGQDGLFTVGLQVTDQAGATATATSTVQVNNVAPTVAFTATSPVAENSPTSIDGTVTDPGWLDLLTATIDFGNGSGAHALTGTYTSVPHGLATLAFSTTHTYGDNSSDASHYTVRICGFDDDTSTCLDHVVTVTNVNPDAHITSPASPAFFHAGETLHFTGTSFDPGSDDRTTTWDFDDGTVVSSNSFDNGSTPDPPNSPSVNPRTVTDAKDHVFTACLYTVTFTATDDDGGASPVDSIVVVIRGNATRAEDSGYWKKQLDGNPTAEITPATLLCYLGITGFTSGVFNELRNASSIPAALAVIDPKNFDVRVKEFDRELLTAWLNFANGAVDFTDTVKTGGHPTITFAAEVAHAEALRANPATTKQQLDDERQILNQFNHLKNHH
jgi:PKD domain-containing protein